MGPELQADADEATFECPLCAHDLYARPARSYAEREGLDGLMDSVLGATRRRVTPGECSQIGWWRLSTVPARRGVAARIAQGLRGVMRRLAGVTARR